PDTKKIGYAFAQDQIDDPAAADVLGPLAAVLEDVGTVAAGVFEGVGEDRHPLEAAVVVDGLSESDSVGGAPGRIESDGTEGVAENVAKQGGKERAATIFARQ